MSGATHAELRLVAALGDRYRIERELGAGGMATVYLARDLRHDRDVAIKVLHPDLGAALGSDRFLGEIRTTARLQHPHILPLLDSGAADGLLYYVMPYVTGETLRARLDRERQLPIDDALRIAREVADALGYAHGHGVIHRDIKPENILLQGAHALVADFGIALAVQQAGGQRMTQTGLSLGTPRYMSPEQAMGERAIDARSDIYALGAVTYEMLAGDPPFIGSSMQAIVARVMTERPSPISTVRDTVPRSVEQAVLTALARLPADRFATAAAFAAALADDSLALLPGSTRRAVRRGAAWRARVRDPLVLGLGALVASLAVALGVLARRAPSADDGFPLRVELPLAAWVGSSGDLPLGGAALSADGHTVAFVGQSPSGAGTSLYLRRLDRLVSRPVPGTDNAGPPVMSPDGKWVAFIAGRRRVMKVPLDGGPAVPLADVPDDGGLDWSANGDIVVGAGVFEGLEGLFRVNAAGGALVPLTHVDTSRKELSHEYPRVLGDGKTILFSIWYGTVDRAELALTSIGDGKVVPLGIAGVRPLGVVDGQLVYVRSDGVVLAVPFDVRRRRVSGSAVPLLDSVRMIGRETGYAAAFMTGSGGLVYGTGSMNRRLMWVDHSGAAHPALAESREFASVRLSPDGRQAAIGITTGSGSDLWMLDLAAGTLTPLTTTGRSRTASWSPDGRRVLYASTHGGRAALWWQPADGGGPAVMAAEPLHNPWWVDLSPDGHTTVFNAIYDGTFNLETFSLDSGHVERDVAASPTATEAFGRFSPDGRAIAYTSDESGRMEVYVRSFPDAGARVQVSAAGGRRPIWAPDGKRIYYWEGSRLMSATLERDPSPRVVSRAPMFEGRYAPDFDVSKDGTRFLMIESGSSGLGLVVVPNWLTELRQSVAARQP